MNAWVSERAIGGLGARSRQEFSRYLRQFYESALIDCGGTYILLLDFCAASMALDSGDTVSFVLTVVKVKMSEYKMHRVEQYKEGLIL